LELHSTITHDVWMVALEHQHEFKKMYKGWLWMISLVICYFCWPSSTKGITSLKVQERITLWSLWLIIAYFNPWHFCFGFELKQKCCVEATIFSMPRLFYIVYNFGSLENRAFNLVTLSLVWY
jgi:hypothetical protein